MTTDMRQAARMEYQQRMKERLKAAPLPLEILMQSSDKITQAQLDAIQEAQRYQNRERIPEPLRRYTDLYNELTGQEPTKATVSDWIATAEDWKDRKLDEDSIRMAWAQAQDINKGFTVGRMGALTVTAVGMKSKAKPAGLVIDRAGIEETKRLLDEKEVKFVPMPDSVRERMHEIKAKRMKELQHG